MKWTDDKLVEYEDGEPCWHPGCKQHMKHPCEVCGRVGAMGRVLFAGKIPEPEE